MKSRKHVQTLVSVEIAALEYLELRRHMSELEARKEELSREIKTYLLDATPTKAARLGGREFFISERSDESFDLKKARLEIEDAKLRKFVRVSTVYSLRVK